MDGVWLTVSQVTACRDGQNTWYEVLASRGYPTIYFLRLQYEQDRLRVWIANDPPEDCDPHHEEWLAADNFLRSIAHPSFANLAPERGLVVRQSGQMTKSGSQWRYACVDHPTSGAEVVAEMHEGNWYCRFYTLQEIRPQRVWIL